MTSRREFLQHGAGVAAALSTLGSADPAWRRDVCEILCRQGRPDEYGKNSAATVLADAQHNRRPLARGRESAVCRD